MVIINDFEQEISDECYDTVLVDDITTFDPQIYTRKSTINGLNVLQMNIRSIKKNFDEFVSLFKIVELYFTSLYLRRLGYLIIIISISL